jgi:type VI secretion system protein ImpA
MYMMTVFDIDSILTQISPEAPSGDADLRDDPAFIDLQIKIAGTPEREFDGKIVQEAKDPNWIEIQDAAVELFTRAHDLRVAMFLTRALLHTDGFNGLGTGLALLYGLIDRYWESLYPQLDPEDNNDPIQRVNILAELSEGEEILGPLKRRTLCASPALGQYSYRDLQIASGKIDATRNDKAPPPNVVDIEAAFKDTDIKDLLAIKAAISLALENLSTLRSALNDKIEPLYSGNLPDFRGLHEVLMEMDTIMEKQLEGRRTPQSSDTNQTFQHNHNGEMQPAGSVTSRKSNPSDVINGRQDVIRLLDQICGYYQLNEPGSPVPMLLKRARQLVEKNFMEIIQDLAPDSAGKIKNLISGAEDS